MTGWIVAVVLLVLLAAMLGRQKFKARVQMHDSLQSAVQEATITFEGHEARAIDPDNPPRWKTWTGIDGRINCTCHTLPIHTGQKVLFWPIPDHPKGGVDLFCGRALDEAWEADR